MGWSSGAVSLNALLQGRKIAYSDNNLSVELIVERMIKGGWPALLNASLNEAVLLNRSYVDLLADADTCPEYGNFS